MSECDQLILTRGNAPAAVTAATDAVFAALTVE
jgi:hypothetical protein